MAAEKKEQEGNGTRILKLAERFAHNFEVLRRKKQR